MSQCVDPIVGKILAGWRYDISGITPEMRRDYERHLAACDNAARASNCTASLTFP